MSRYIKADDLKKEMDELEGWFKDLKWKIENLEEYVKPVVRGEWIKIDKLGRIVKCSKCGNTLDLRGVNAGRGDANYCPNCGADMIGEEDE